MVVLGIDLGTVWTKAALFIETQTGGNLIPLDLDKDAVRDYGEVGHVMQSALYYKGIKNFVKPGVNSADVTYKVYQFNIGQKAVNNMYATDNLEFFYDRIKPGINEDNKDLVEIQEGFKTYMLAAAMIFYITRIAMETLQRYAPSSKIDKYVVSVPATTKEGDQRWTNMLKALLVPANEELNNQVCIEKGDITILREPEAAGYYLLRSLPSSDGCFYLVYDFGGGTFDCSILKSKDGIVLLKDSAEHSSVGRNQLGGNDIDELIRKQLYIQNPGLEEDLISLCKSDNAADKAKLETLRDAIYHLPKRVKLALAKDEIYSESSLLHFTITKEKFEILIKGLVSTSIACCDDLLTSNGLSWKDISGVLMIGGTSRIPLIKRMIEEHIKFERPNDYDSVKIILENGEKGICSVASGCAAYHFIKPKAKQLLELGKKELYASHFSDAEFFFDKAHQVGDNTAPFYLGMMHYLGLSPDSDGVNYKTALHYFEMEDTNQSLFQRAVCYIKSQGVKRDESAAIFLLNQVKIDNSITSCLRKVLACTAEDGEYIKFYNPCFSLIMDELSTITNLK